MKSGSRIGHAIARIRLLAASSVGRRPRTKGIPFIQNRGELTIGNDFVLASAPVQSHMVVSRGARLSIGSGVIIGSGAAISCASDIRIDDHVHLGRGVMIMDSDFHETEAMGSAGRAIPIVIGHGVRIGDGVVILKGSSIGEGARVAAGSVVSGALAPNVLATGVPARPRTRSTESRGINVDARVLAVVAETFDLDRAAESADGPSTIARWDSLGTLRLLLALEDDLGIHLAEDALASVNTIGDLTAIVASALDAT